MKFTKEELYEIEKNFDSISGILMRRLHETAEQFMYFNIKEHKEVAKLLLNQFKEIDKAMKIAKTIRDKCEKERLK